MEIQIKIRKNETSVILTVGLFSVFYYFAGDCYTPTSDQSVETRTLNE